MKLSVKLEDTGVLRGGVAPDRVGSGGEVRGGSCVGSGEEVLCAREPGVGCVGADEVLSNVAILIEAEAESSGGKSASVGGPDS